MLKPIIREARIILILETCLVNKQKVHKKELFIISRYHRTENNLYVQHIENGGSWLNYFQNYKNEILELLNLNND